MKTALDLLTYIVALVAGKLHKSVKDLGESLMHDVYVQITQVPTKEDPIDLTTEAGRIKAFVKETKGNDERHIEKSNPSFQQ